MECGQSADEEWEGVGGEGKTGGVLGVAGGDEVCGRAGIRGEVKGHAGEGEDGGFGHLG